MSRALHPPTTIPDYSDPYMSATCFLAAAALEAAALVAVAVQPAAAPLLERRGPGGATRTGGARCP